MTTKITIVLDNPAGSNHFEAAYPALVTRAHKIPGSQRMETSKVWPKEDGTPTPAYRTIDLYSTDYDSASRVVIIQEAGDFFQRAFEMATGGARAVFADIEES